MLAGALCLGLSPLQAQQTEKQYSLDNQVTVPGGDNITTIDATGESIRKILRDLSLQAGFNLVMDDSVTGNVTIALNQVSVNHALQSITALSGLEIIPRSGNIYLAITKQAAVDKGLNTALTKIIKIQYGNSQRIASLLNNSIFAPRPIGGNGGGANAAGGGGGGAGGGGGGQTAQRVRNDPRTNSIIVVGTARDIELAEENVARLDQPRQSKTFYLSHANALDIATLIAGSIFNDGTNILSAGGGGGGGGGGGAGGDTSSPTQVRVDQETLQEGSGTNNLGGGGGGGGGNLNASLGQSITLRGVVKASTTASVSADGPLVVPDSRTNSVTIMGTAEQISLAERVIPILDAQVPQVAIEVSLVEVTTQGIRELSNNLGLSSGSLQTGFNNAPIPDVQRAVGFPDADPGTPANPPFAGGQFPAGLVGLPTVDANGNARSGILLTTNPLVRKEDAYVTSIRALIRSSKAKLLANPTIIANHDTEAVINIVDEIVRNVQVQIADNTVTSTVQIGEAGITLDILPKIGEDGTINLRVRPSVTTVRDIQRFLGNEVTLLRKRDILVQNVRIRDGETLLIGGLVDNRDVSSNQKLPGAGDLPIVGALFRAQNRTKDRSEIVMMVTPHILNNTKLTPVNYQSPSGASSFDQGGNE